MPLLINKGRGSTRRPDFSADEYHKLIRVLPSWIDKGHEGKSRAMRHLLRDYVLILANTGIRHGTEADNLRWKHITLFEEKGDVFLEMSVHGKTRRRDIICRGGRINYLKRIRSWCPDVAYMSFLELIKAKIDLPVFRLPDGTASQNLSQTFKRLMIDTGVLTHLGLDRTEHFTALGTPTLVFTAQRWYGHTHAGDTNGHLLCFDRASLKSFDTMPVQRNAYRKTL